MNCAVLAITTSSHFTLNTLSSTALRVSLRREKKRGDRTTSKMLTHALTDLIVALLHVVTGPRRHRCRVRRGGRHHHCQAVAPADPPPPSVALHW
jgi:DNA-binding MurR/RpiR family transcriptional regulator